MNVKDRIIDFGYWVGWRVLWMLPTRVTNSFFNLIARSLWRFNTKGVKQLKLNLSRVTNLDVSSRELGNLAKQGLVNYLRYYAETFRLPRLAKHEILDSVRPVNVEPILKALESGGVILALPHSGNWDQAGAWAAKFFGSLCTIAERLRPESVYQKFTAMRTAQGITLMPLTGAGGTYEFLRSQVNAGKVVALLSDRDLSGSGMGVTFFSSRAPLPIGAALLGIDTGRPIFTLSSWYDGQSLVIEFDNGILIDEPGLTGRERLRRAQDVTGQIAKQLEQHISRHPSDWHMLQPIWPDLIASK